MPMSMKPEWGVVVVVVVPFGDVVAADEEVGVVVVLWSMSSLSLGEIRRT